MALDVIELGEGTLKGGGVKGIGTRWGSKARGPLGRAPETALLPSNLSLHGTGGGASR